MGEDIGPMWGIPSPDTDLVLRGFSVGDQKGLQVPRLTLGIPLSRNLVLTCGEYDLAKLAMLRPGVLGFYR